MKSITAKSPHDSSFSFSRRFLNWKKKPEDEFEDEEEEVLTFSSAYQDELKFQALDLSAKIPQKKPISKLKRALSLFKMNKNHPYKGLGTKVVGTLFGYRRGHVHFAFQEDPNSRPGFLVELAIPTSILVREMASGLVRIALECERKSDNNKKGGVKLLDEPIWRTYCNGKKCGYGVRRDCGPEDWKVLSTVGPVTMGAGVLPAEGEAAEENGSGNGEGELMYMRARFERVVGSRDSEAFYMMNPDGHGGPELSIYLLRV